MAGKKQTKLKITINDPNLDNPSGGESTPTQDNRTDTENGEDTDRSSLKKKEYYI